MRDAALEALTRHGFELLEPVKGTGGARLKVMKGGEIALALVRTSSDRWVGWMRDANGNLKGLEDADIVVVAAVDDAKSPTSLEVLAFDPDVVLDAFEANLAAREEHSGGLSPTAPVFVCLDETRKEKPAATSSNLKTSAIWTETITPSDESLAADLGDDDEDWSGEITAEDLAGMDDDFEDQDDYGKFDLQAFLDDVKADLAARLNVPETCISLELRLKL